MKDSYRQVSLTRLCRLLGITRQAYYQHFWFVSDCTMQQQIVLQQVQDIRKLHPVIGGRKLYCMLQPFLLEHQVKIGRDALFDLLAVNKLLVRRKRRHVHTTQSHHWLKKYPNLVKNWKPSSPQQLWVADITYVPVSTGFLYLNLITDAYSHKVVGYHIGENLGTVNTLKALEMALQTNPNSKGLIHHSDRGIQYCSSEYVSFLKQHHIQISMTESGDPLENALAERINGIVKNEYLKHSNIKTYKEALKLVETAIEMYNCQRPHFSINLLTPSLVHELKIPVNRTWSKRLNIVNQ